MPDKLTETFPPLRTGALTAADRAQWAERGFVHIPRERWLGDIAPLLDIAASVPRTARAHHTYERLAGGEVVRRTSYLEGDPRRPPRKKPNK